MPYTGSMLTPDDVDRYIVRGADGSICLADALDTVCFTLVPEGADVPNAPIIHVYLSKLIYVFYHEDVPILQVEIVMDTTGIRQALTDRNQGAGSSGDDPLGAGNINADAGETDRNQGAGSSGDDPLGAGNINADAGDTDTGGTDDGETDELFSGNDGWFIRIYYPEGRALPRGVLKLEDSGLKIKINGQPIRSADIEGFARITGSGGSGVQFFYPNVSGISSQLTVEVTGLVSDEETVTFNVDSPTETVRRI